jgi:hypothetical protein
MNVKAIIYAITIACLFSIVGCAGTTATDSETYKATILYFEGGSGQIKHFSENKLINRSSHYFRSQGIIIKYMALNLPWPSFKGFIERYSASHFHKIQKKVNSLIEKGHSSIWLMGISMGVISVLNAGANHIQGVEGLVVINAPDTGLRWGELKKIKLPILAVTHEEDAGPLKDLSADDFKKHFKSSIRPEIVIFSGGVTGTSREANQFTQKYQHGLRGLEQQFAQAVIDFIDANHHLQDGQ